MRDFSQFETNLVETTLAFLHRELQSSRIRLMAFPNRIDLEKNVNEIAELIELMNRFKRSFTLKTQGVLL